MGLRVTIYSGDFKIAYEHKLKRVRLIDDLLSECSKSKCSYCVPRECTDDGVRKTWIKILEEFPIPVIGQYLSS